LNYNIITRYNIPQFYYEGVCVCVCVCVCGYLLCGLMIIMETDKHINIDI